LRGLKKQNKTSHKVKGLFQKGDLNQLEKVAWGA
jgi:hypothetical protein